MPYSAETMPSQVIHDMLDSNWNEYSGSIPKPQLIMVTAPSQPVRTDTRSNSAIVIAVEPPALEETPIGNWVYGHRTTKVLLELHTKVSRQRLYDLMQEVRRICHSQMHSLTSYQRVRFVNFLELTEEEMNYWTGRVIITLENNAVLLET